MFHINVWLTVKDAADVARVRELLAEACRLSRAEPGALAFDVFHSQADPQKFLLCERWASEQAWKDHRDARAFREIYQPHVLPLVDRDPHISELIA
ncbi:MAG: antibiotic biosynthesis monooxygenase [Planctomycetales bacterium]|nr:antibiotic biosynthesis monooxygenase [Planctomycetales bacterium]